MRPSRLAGLNALVSCMTACVIVQGANAQAPDLGPETAALRSGLAPHIVFEPASTDANVSGVVLSCERREHDIALQLQVYTRNGQRLLPDRRAGARPKAEPAAFVALDGRRFDTRLLFADLHAVLSDRDGSVPGLSHEFVAALRNARTMVLTFDLLEEAAGTSARFDSKTTIRLDDAGRAGVRAVANCLRPGAST